MRKPDIQLNIWLSSIGWEWSIYVEKNPDLRTGEVRDFSLDYEVSDLEETIAKKIVELMIRMRKGL